MEQFHVSLTELRELPIALAIERAMDLAEMQQKEAEIQGRIAAGTIQAMTRK